MLNHCQELRNIKMRALTASLTMHAKKQTSINQMALLVFISNSLHLLSTTFHYYCHDYQSRYTCLVQYYSKEDSLFCIQIEVNDINSPLLDAVLIENMHDIPYINRNVGPEIIAGMAAVCSAVKREVAKMPCGIQILAGCNEQAIAVAKACNLDFVRAEGFVFSHVADEGIMNSDAGQLLRYRKKINAENVLIFTDIKKKHSSHSITSDLDLLDVAKAAEFFLSDGVIITGTHTGVPVEKGQVELLKNSNFQLPIFIGSGVNQENLSEVINADGLIVGSYFKENGDWRNNVDADRLSCFMKKVHHLRTWKN